jgi:hypothetical protein
MWRWVPPSAWYPRCLYLCLMVYLFCMADACLQVISKRKPFHSFKYEEGMALLGIRSTQDLPEQSTPELHLDAKLPEQVACITGWGTIQVRHAWHGCPSHACVPWEVQRPVEMHRAELGRLPWR